jgi:DNA-binding response OmpR family regulator
MAELRNIVILLIDDSPDTLLTMTKILEMKGATVFGAQSVSEGFRLIGDKIPHLIISDLLLPDEDGFSLIKKCRETPAYSKIPILVLSGLEDQDSINKAMALGASDYAIKSLRPDSLLQKISKALRYGDYRCYNFSEETAPALQVSVSATVLMANETSVLIESSLRLVEEEEVVINAPPFEDLEVIAASTLTMNPSGRFVGPGRFISRIRWIGLQSSVVKNLRTKLKTWSAQ